MNREDTRALAHACQEAHEARCIVFDHHRRQGDWGSALDLFTETSNRLSQALLYGMILKQSGHPTSQGKES